MATYNQISYGSKGSDVTELQKLLNQNGYNLDLDGNFGPKTQAAVKEYQQKNGLSVDGIVGKNTWGALTSASTATPTTPAETPTETKAPTFEYGAYKPSDTVAQAEALLQQQLAQKPGDYQSAWQTQLNDVLQKILNREQFSYDLNGDALYQQYKDQYTTQGKMAMMDTMGQAAALTGGYGNSYAQSVGQQAYQGYLQGLNDKVPELYQLALSQYQAEGDAMYNQAALMAQMEDQDYGRYRDQVAEYYAELERLNNQYNTERDYDYSKWADDRNFGYGQFIDDRNLAYQTERDKIADQQWQAQFDEAKRQFDLQYSKSSSGGGGGSGGSYKSGSSYSAPEGLDIENTIDPTNTTPAVVDTSSVSSDIKSKASSFKANVDLGNYLDGLVASGTITEAQADSLYAQYKQPDTVALSNRSWTLVDDGGVNWFGGIDNNATVKDQYDNTYRLDKLVDALVAEGMSEDKAKDYVKKLQGKLGA